MKKQIQKLLFIFMLAVVSILKAQTGETCATAIPIPESSSISSFSISGGTIKWLSFNSISKKIIFRKSENPNWVIKNYQVYSGTCATLNFVKADTNTNLDSSFTITSQITTGFIKLEFQGNTTNIINFIQIPQAASVACTPGNICELINNGDFSSLNSCVGFCIANPASACGTTSAPCPLVTLEPFSYNYVNAWTNRSFTPQIDIIGSNYFTYMWTDNSTGAKDFESIENALCFSTVATKQYQFKADMAFVQTNLIPSSVNGTLIDKIVIELYNSGSPALQKITVKTNLSLQSFNAYTFNFMANGNYSKMRIYPLNDVSTKYSGFRIDNISIKPIISPNNFVFAPITIPCGSTAVIPNLATFVQINSTAISSMPVTFNFTGPGVLLNNGLYTFDPTLTGIGVHTITCNYTDCLGNNYSGTTNISIGNAACCGTPNFGIPINTSVSLSAYQPGSPATISGLIIDIGDNATLIIDYPVTFNNCKFRMGKGAKIDVNIGGAPTNRILNLTNQCAFYSCGQYMHNGVIVNPSNTINSTSSTFEDAKFAIRLFVGCTANLNGNTFNKNYIGVYINPEVAATANYQFIFNNNSFTTNASLNSPSLTMKDVIPLLGTGFITPVRGYAGIYSVNLGNAFALKIGQTTSPTAGNTFDNIDIGIYLNRTKGEIYNNTFNTNNGTGIFTTTLNGSTVNYGYNLIVGNGNTNGANKFNNCKYGIELGNGYNNVSLEWNRFIGSSLNTNLIAINAPIDKMTTLNVNNNTSDYYNNFFQHSILTLPATSAAGLTLNVNSNTINHAVTPIFAAQNGGSNTTTFVYNMSSNIINTSSNGILTNNMAKCLRIENNNITILNTALGFSEAIALTGGCNDAWVKNNTIKSDAATVNNVSNTDLFGIHVTQSANTQVSCNSMDKMGTCLAFEGPCLTGSNFINANVLQSGVYGLRLMNSGRIGTQGNSTTKNENSWGAAAGSFPGATRFQTYVQNTANVGSLTTGSVLYFISGSAPTDNGALSPPATILPYSSTLNPASLRVASNNGSTLSCGGGGGSLTAARIADVGTPIANNTASYANFTTDNTLRAKQQLYQMVEDVPSAKADANINTFYNTAKNACIGKLKQVSDEINAQNYSAAIFLNNSITTTCNTDASEKQYYQLYLKYITDAPNFNNQDKADLVLLANRCPQKRGAVVYKARVLNDFITQMQNSYSDNCNSITNAKVVSDFPFDGDDLIVVEKNKSIGFSNAITISPNPNSGQFTINLNGLDLLEIKVKLLSPEGNIVYLKEQKVSSNIVNLNVENLASGIYILQIYSENNLLKTEKIVINRND
jgi:hypothetical protein